VRIVVSPADALFDVAASTTISGLPAGARVTVTASQRDDASGQMWTSSAVFMVGSSGVLPLSQPPVSGSYQGSDEMGLVETLAPPELPGGVPQFLETAGAGKFDIELGASIDGHVVATATMTRQRETVTPRTETPAATGVYGRLFLPAHETGRKPAVLVFGGSEGGLSGGVVEHAAALAAQGYPALAIAYFDEPGLPSTLQDVPLEYFVKALNLLAKQPGVDANHLLVWGTSRGGEAALLLGAHFPNLVHGVIAAVPSAVVWGSYPETGSAAWTLDGKPVPYASSADWNNPDPADAQDAIIPVEQTRGPVFLVCGGEDQVWASCPYTDAITARLTQHRFGYPVTALRYPAAGHYGGDLNPYLPFADAAGPTAAGAETGGSELADQQAEADSWPRLLSFLARV
jgi:dienelactone hydrolase